MLPRRIFLVWLIAALLAPAPAALEAQQRQRLTREQRELRASAQRFAARADAILAGENARRGHWGLLVVDAATGETLYSRNPGSYFTPASNTKLYTTALAMATLGPEHTVVTWAGTYGRVDAHGRLLGDLILRGNGDPNLSNRAVPYNREQERDGAPEKILAELAGKVAAAGIRQIEGDIVAGDLFPRERYPSGWAIEDMPAGYGAPVSGLMVNDNVLAIEVRPAEREGERAWFGAEPWADFYEFTNEITTVAAGAQSRVRLERDPGSRRVVLRGEIARDRAPMRLTLAVEEPAEHAAALFKRLLEARGVRIYGRAAAQYAQELPAAGLLVLAEHRSAPFIEAVRIVNKVSQNQHAEVLLRLAARQKGANSTREALEFAAKFFAEIGIGERDIALYDGSGLSRRNLISPQSTVTLLQWVAAQPWGELYIATLPVAGVDGTLGERMKGTPAQGRIQAKTGTLGSVNALSGFATTLGGRRVIFSMFGNLHNLRGREATDVLDALCVALVEEIGSPSRR
jgi:D-alanyl-D-alanine carboxypeptidase/D-alanyl-D-alanine-endopeptidase (penicillin-binding protein 4)